MSDRQEMIVGIAECLQREPIEARQRHAVRETEGWEFAAGYWPSSSEPVQAAAAQAIRHFDEILHRSELTVGQINIDSCVFDYGATNPESAAYTRAMRGVGLWLRPLMEVDHVTDAS